MQPCSTASGDPGGGVISFAFRLLVQRFNGDAVYGRAVYASDFDGLSESQRVLRYCYKRIYRYVLLVCAPRHAVFQHCAGVYRAC